MQFNTTVKGMKNVQSALARLRRDILSGRGTIGKELGQAATDIVLAPVGAGDGGKKFYPPQTEHNRPPVPFYERGVGEHWAGHIERNSAQMNLRFYNRTMGKDTKIGNTAPYAPDVIGMAQLPLFKSIGWLRLIDRARRSQVAIRDAWVKIILGKIKAIGLRKP